MTASSASARSKLAANVPAESRNDFSYASCMSLPPVRRCPGVSGYRIFMTIVFVCVVLVDEWLDSGPSASAIADIVGPASVVVWAVTLLGSFGVGPVAAIWRAMRR